MSFPPAAYVMRFSECSPSENCASIATPMTLTVSYRGNGYLPSSSCGLAPSAPEKGARIWIYILWTVRIFVYVSALVGHHVFFLCEIIGLRGSAGLASDDVSSRFYLLGNGGMADKFLYFIANFTKIFVFTKVSSFFFFVFTKIFVFTKFYESLAVRH